MSRKKNASRGLFADIGGMLIVQLLSFVAIRYYFKFISGTDYGYWVVILAIVGWIGLADFGIGFAATRFFIKALSGEDKETREDDIDKIANTSLFLFLIIAVFFLVVGLCLYPLFGNWVHVEETRERIFFNTFLITLISTTIAIPFAIFSGILEAKQKIALNRNIQTANLVIQLFASISFVILFKSIIGLALGLLAGTFISSLALYYYARREMVINFSRKHVNKELLKRLSSFGGYFQLGKTANIIATTTDTIFIASYLDVSKVPAYNFTSKVPVLFCNAIASKIPTALFSGLSQVFDQGNLTSFKKLFKKLFDIMVRLAFFAAIMIFFLNEKFVDLWMGKNNFGGFYLNIVFVYWVFFETIIRGTGIVIQIFGNLKMWALSAVFESVLNIGLSFYFLYTGWGIAGLALATAIARTLTIGVYWAWFLNNKDLLGYKKLFYNILLNVLKNLPLFLILYIFSKLVHLDNLALDLVVYSVIGLLINLVCYDGDLLVKAFQKRSFKALYSSYMEKY